ncbi:zeta toxin family protein [Kiloniella laminariae]|uniref:zeta toxin family protein n=1 Tax=Kiloniella laminariae TaxID=454162 RepID=UPI00037E7F08|nr:zeta toxin family protein [Kiloniella laminariae]
MSKRLWIIAGPNGAGKSTLVSKYNLNQLPVSNPDVIAQRLSPSAPEAAMVQAGRQAIKERSLHFTKGNSFILETTFSGKTAISTISNAQSKGYKVNLVFVALKSSRGSMLRVDTRVRSGGHFVSAEDIQRRYTRASENLKKAIPIADRTFIIDNTGQRPFLIARLEKGVVKKVRSRIPKWIDELLPLLKKQQGLSR